MTAGAQIGSQGVNLISPPRRYGDRGAIFGQQPGKMRAQTAAGAGDHGHLPGKLGCAVHIETLLQLELD